MPRSQETPREKGEGMVGDEPGQSTAGPLGRGEMAASFRFMEGQANGLSVFLEADAGGGCERGEGNLGGAKPNRAGPVVPERGTGGCGGTTDQGQAKKCGQSPTAGGQVSERSTKHSTWPHHTPRVHVYAPAERKSNGETARPSRRISQNAACVRRLSP